MQSPFITQLSVYDCYASKDFKVPSVPLDSPKHIILTGQNGAGKTTILRRIANILGVRSGKRSKASELQNLRALIHANPGHTSLKTWKSQIAELEGLDVHLSTGALDNYIAQNNDKYIFAYFAANRLVNVNDVTSVTKEADFMQALNKKNPEEFGSQFKQYLVNKKIYEAFDFMNSNTETQNINAVFFQNLTKTLRSIFADDELELEFVQEDFEFYLKLQDGRRMTFNQLSAGFSAFISILMELLIRVDLVRRTQKEFSINPPGVVVIDEPETHFHLSMQYEILPLLTTLFPNFQFIVATHSPAVISSIKNAVVFDITSKKELFDKQAGSSYSELMIKHFGLDNEFSPVADQILSEMGQAIEANDVEKLKSIILVNEKYLTPSLRFEIENQIIALEAKNTR